MGRTYPAAAGTGSAARWHGRTAALCDARSSSVEADHVDAHLQGGAGTIGEYHAVEGGDVAVVATPGHRDVVGRLDEVVGGVEVQPAAVGQRHRAPGMGGGRAHQRRLTVGGTGLEIAAHI